MRGKKRSTSTVLSLGRICTEIKKFDVTRNYRKSASPLYWALVCARLGEWKAWAHFNQLLSYAARREQKYKQRLTQTKNAVIVKSSFAFSTPFFLSLFHPPIWFCLLHAKLSAEVCVCVYVWICECVCKEGREREDTKKRKYTVVIPNASL